MQKLKHNMPIIFGLFWNVFEFKYIFREHCFINTCTIHKQPIIKHYIYCTQIQVQLMTTLWCYYKEKQISNGSKMKIQKGHRCNHVISNSILIDVQSEKKYEH